MQRERATGYLSDGLEYRLPTEAQWEYACRAGTTTRFYYGDDPNHTELGKYAWFGEGQEGSLHPVDETPPNPWGLHGMLGNVSEWCSDWYWGDPAGSYSGGEQVDPVGLPTSSWFRVIRGGNWFLPARACRTTYRRGVTPSDSFFNRGFRPVLVPTEYPKSPEE